MNTKILSINLDTRTYDIYIGGGLLTRIHDLLPDEIGGRSAFIITDRNVEAYAKTVQQTLQAQGMHKVDILVLQPGEQAKSFENFKKVNEWMLESGLNRNSIVFAVGGGVIGDLGGFCASSVMRGVPYIQVPTSLLAQVDSSVGGKTGINAAQGKNLVGSFYQPGAVIADIDTLQTLPKRELLAGYAEVAKYGLIQDKKFFEWLQPNGEKVIALEEEAVAHAIETSCAAKAKVVEEDEKEQGRRALLNLGHTFGHALEAEAGYGGSLLHGEAVAIGMVMAFDLSARMGLCDQDDVDEVEEHLQEIGLPTRAGYIDALATSVDSLLERMRHDKKVVSGQMTFVLVKGIGQAFLSQDAPEELVREVLHESLGAEHKEGRGQWSSKFSSLS